MNKILARLHCDRDRLMDSAREHEETLPRLTKERALVEQARAGILAQVAQIDETLAELQAEARAADTASPGFKECC